MKLSTREKLLLFILGIVGILIIGINFILLPSWRSYQALQVERDNYVSRQIEAQTLLQRAQTIDKSLEEGKELMQKATQPFLQELDIEYIDKWLHKMAEGTGTEILSLQIMPSQAQSIAVYKPENEERTYPIKEYYQILKGSEEKDSEEAQMQEQLDTNDSILQLPITLTLGGTNEAILQLVNKLNASPIHLNIDSFTLAQKDTLLNMTLYMIEKDADKQLDYTFPTPSGKSKLID